jgi:B-box zinc finger
LQEIRLANPWIRRKITRTAHASRGQEANWKIPIKNMKCYIHRSSDAIAVCRSCGRALCPDCVSEVGLSCACKNRCEADVARFNEMITRGRPGGPNPVNPASLVSYDRVIFLMAMGLAFVWFGLYYLGGHGPGLFFAVLGAAFFVFGISQFFTTKSFRAKFRDKKD